MLLRVDLGCEGAQPGPVEQEDGIRAELAGGPDSIPAPCLVALPPYGEVA